MKNIVSKFLMILFIVAQCSSCSSSCKHTPSDSYNVTYYNWLKLKGDVKYIEMSIYNENDSLIDFKSFEFNRRKETIERNFKDGNGDDIREVELYNEYGTSVKRERYKNGVLMEYEIGIDSINERGDVVQKHFYDIGNQLKSTVRYSYNTNGDILTSDYKNLEDGGFSKREFNYDDDGKLLEERFTRRSLEEKTLRLFVYKYNLNGQITSYEQSWLGEEPDSKELWKYDTNHNLIENIRYLSDTNNYNLISINYDTTGVKLDSIRAYYAPNDIRKTVLQNEEIYTFDKNGNIVKRVYRNEEKIDIEVNRKYSEENILKEEIAVFSDGSIKKSIYDEYGNPKLERFYDKDNQLISEEEFQTSYDACGNITEMIHLKDGKILGVQKRKYRYF